MLSQWKHWTVETHKHTIKKHNENYEPAKYCIDSCGGKPELCPAKKKQTGVSKYLGVTNLYPEHPCGSQYQENPSFGWMDHHHLRKIQKPNN